MKLKNGISTCINHAFVIISAQNFDGNFFENFNSLEQNKSKVESQIKVSKFISIQI